jgi:hypothetical protein
VPLVQIVPKPPPERSFDINGTIGTRGPHVAQPSPDPAADCPQGWRGALLGLSPDHDPCPGFQPDAWARVQANALAFIDRHGDVAQRLGWTAVELFGVHPALGAIRVDCAGALMLCSAGQVASVEADLIRYVNGLAFRRSFGSGASVPVWTFGRADAIHLRR